MLNQGAATIAYNDDIRQRVPESFTQMAVRLNRLLFNNHC